MRDGFRMAILAGLVAGLVGCQTPPEYVTPEYSKVIQTAKSPAELYKAATVGLFRTFTRPAAAVEFSNPELGLIVAEGYVEIPKPPNISTQDYDRVWFRLIIDVEGSSVRLVVEDIHFVWLTLDGALRHSSERGIPPSLRTRFELAMNEHMKVLERSLLEW